MRNATEQTVSKCCHWLFLCVFVLFLTLRIPPLILVILFSAPLAASHLLFLFCSSWCPHSASVSKILILSFPPSPSSSLFQGTTPQFPALLSKLSTASASFITRFTRGASRSFKDAKMRNTVSYTVFFSLGGTPAGGKQNKQKSWETFFFFCKLWNLKKYEMPVWRIYITVARQMERVLNPFDLSNVQEPVESVWKGGGQTLDGELSAYHI